MIKEKPLDEIEIEITRKKDDNLAEEKADSSFSSLEEKEDDLDIESSSDKNLKKSLWTQFKEICIILKHLLFSVFLMLFSLTNFSYLNFPYTILGAIIIILLFINNSNTIKTLTTIFYFIISYASSVLVFKLVIAILYWIRLKSPELFSDFLYNNKVLLIDLGNEFLNDDNYTKWIKTFLNDLIIFISYFIFQIYKFNYNNFKEEEMKTFLRKCENKEGFVYLILVFLIMSVNSVYVSFLSFGYGLFFIFTLLLWSMGGLKRSIKTIYTSLIIISLLHLSAYHFFNIYSFRMDVLEANAKYFNWAGIIEMAPQFYYFADYTIIVLIYSFSLFGLNLEHSLKKTKEFSSVVVPIESQEKPNPLQTAFNIFIHWIESPYFILHFVRISFIIFSYLFHNYFSCVLIIYILITFLLVNVKKYIMYINYVFIWPALVTLYNLLILSNIEHLILENVEDEVEKKLFSHYGLQKFDSNTYVWFFYIIHLTILFFCIFSRLLTKYFNENKNCDMTTSLVEYKKVHKNLGESLLEEQEEIKHMTTLEVKRITFSDLLIKIFIVNIDKISLIFMYLVAIKVVNVFHFILVLIFLIQLIFPKVIRKIIFWLLLTLEVILLFEYIWDFIDLRIEKSTLLINILSFLTELDTKEGEMSSENLIFVILYLLYIQYQNYNSDVYKKYNTKYFSFQNYFSENFENFPNLRNWVSSIYIIIQGLYVWLILSLIFLCIVLKDINIQFLITLILYLLLVYKFIYFKQNNGIITLSWIFIIYSGLTTTIIYYFQFTSLDLIKSSFQEFLKTLPDIVRENLNLLGFTLYKNEDLPLKFLPHYGTNLLSVLVLYETKRLFLLYEKDSKIQTKRKNRNKSLFLDENQLDYYNLDKWEIPYCKYYTYLVINVFSKAYWFCIFFIIYVLTVSYQLSVAQLCYMIVFTYGSMKLFKMYLNDIIKTEEKFNRKGRKMFFLIKLIKYGLVEKNFHYKTQKKYKVATLKVLLIFAFVFIILTYIFAIFKLWVAQTQEHYVSIEFVDCLCYIIGIYHIKERSILTSIIPHFIFIILIIVESYNISLQNHLNIQIEKMEILTRAKNKFELEKAINSFITTSMMCSSNIKNVPMRFSMSSYNINFNRLQTESDINFNVNANMNTSENINFQKTQNFITEVEEGNLSKDNENIKKRQTQEKERSKSCKLITKSELPENIVPTSNKTVHFLNEVPYANTENQLGEIYKLEGQSENLNNTIYIETENELRDKIMENPIIKKFLKIFENVSKNSSFFTNKLKSKNISLDYYFAFKLILEEAIVLALLITTIMKLNIFSVFYLALILIIQIKGKNTKNLYYLTVILIFLVLFQYCLILTNINEQTDPTPNKEVLKSIQELLGIPWYLKFDFLDSIENIKWAFYFSFGTDKFQLLILGWDFAVILLCFIYLENYSYLIFQNNEKFKNKINLNLLRKKKSFNDILNKISEDDYNLTRETLKANFEIEIAEYEIFDRHLRGRSTSTYSLNLPSSLNKKINEFLFKLNRKTKYYKFFVGLKSFLYLTIHNLVLTLIIILSILHDGAISVFYLIFSFFHLNRTTNILLGLKTTYPRKMKRLFIYLIFADLVIQILYQVPFSIEIMQIKGAKLIMDSIGIKNAIKSYTPFKVDDLSINILSLKAFIFFLCSIQNLIYSSKDFKEFYTYYIFENKEKTLLFSAMNSSLFNNKRLETMQMSMDYRMEISTVLLTLEEHLNKWDQKLSGNAEFFDIKNKKSLREFSKKMEKINPYYKQEDEDVKELDQGEEKVDIEMPLSKGQIIVKEIVNTGEHEFREIVKKMVMKDWVIKLAFFMNRISTSYFFVSKKEKEELETAIIKGFTHIPCRIQRKINKFLDCFTFAEFISMKRNEEPDFDFKFDPSNEDDLLKLEKLIQQDQNQKLIIDELMKKEYLPTGYLIKFITLKAIQYCAANFQYTVYFFMLLNHIMNANLLSLFWPILIFCYALLEYPRPKKEFWTFALHYAIFLTIFKFLLQLELILIMFNLKDIQNFRFEDRLKIGIKIFPKSFSLDFFDYVIWDCLVILFVLFEQYILIRLGIWDKCEREIETNEEAYDRIAKANSINENNIKREFDKLIKKSSAVHHRNKKEKEKSKMEVESYAERLFPKLRNKKPGKDFYAFYTASMMLLILYIIFFYTNMDQNKIFDMQDKIKIRQFSGAMVLMAFFHVFLAVLDRIIYLKQNRTNFKLVYMYYNKATGDRFSEEDYSKIAPSTPELEKLYKKTYLQIEETNYPLISKYFLHIFVVIFSHVLIFWYLPIRGNYNLHNYYYCDINNHSSTGEAQSYCNDFHYNGSLIAFYIIYLFYLIFSSIQIHYGLLDMKKKSLFMRGDNYVNSISFQTFNAIPFLYELKLMIDWTIIPTALDLFKWIKFESVYDRIFLTHCSMKTANQRKIGEKITLFNKLSLGGCGFVILLFILLGPLLLFSNLNPTNKSNNIFASEIEISLAFVNDGVFSNFTLFRNSQAKSIRNISSDDVMEDLNLSSTTQTRNFPREQIQVIRMPNVSDTNWILAQPHIETILNNIKNYKERKTEILILFDYSFTRAYPANAQTAFNSLIFPIVSDGVEQTDVLTDLINNLNCVDTPVKLKEFYKPTIHLSADITADPFLDPRIPSLNSELKLNCLKTNGNATIDYSRSYFSFILTDEFIQKKSNGIIFVTFSDFVSETTASYDVIGFYISFILVIGRVIRGFISGEETRIILTEMPEPESLITLCEGIKISRYRRDFIKEEYLYYVLIDLMRSPEIMKIITKSCIKKIKEKEDMEKKNN